MIEHRIPNTYIHICIYTLRNVTRYLNLPQCEEWIGLSSERDSNISRPDHLENGVTYALSDK